MLRLLALLLALLPVLTACSSSEETEAPADLDRDAIEETDEGESDFEPEDAEDLDAIAEVEPTDLDILDADVEESSTDFSPFDADALEDLDAVAFDVLDVAERLHGLLGDARVRARRPGLRGSDRCQLRAQRRITERGGLLEPARRRLLRQSGE